MGNVQFDEVTYEPVSRARPEAKGLTGALVRSGIAPNAQVAQYLLLGSAVCCFFIAVGISFSIQVQPTMSPAEYAQRAQHQPYVKQLP